MDDGQSFLSPLGRNQNSPDSSILGPESLAAADHISPFDFHPPSMVTTKRRGSKKRGVRFDEKLQTPSPSLRRSVQISRLSSSVAMGMSPMVDALDLNGTPKSVIRSKLLAKEAELEELKEFTKLEQECKNEEVEWQKEAQKMKWENSVLEKKVAALTESKNKLEQDIKFFQTENEGFWKEKYEGDKEERKQDAKQLQNEEKCKQVHIELENALEVTNGLREMVFKLRNELQDQESQEKEFKEKTECINAELILKLQHMNEKCTEKEDLLTRKNEIIESLRDQLLKSSEQINESVKLTEDIKKEKEVLAHEKSEVVSELLEAKTCIQKLSTDLEKANLEKDETYQKLLDQESRAKVLLKDYESLLSNTQECTTQNQKSHELQIQEQIKLINEEHNLKWKEMSKKSIEMEEKLSEKNEIIENLRNQLGDSKKETEENVKLIEEVKSNNRALTSTNEILANEKSGLFTELLESKTCITRLSFDLEKAKVDKDKINLDLLAQESKAEALLKDYESLLSSTQDCTVRNQMSHELELQKEIKSITEEHALKFKEMTKKTNEMEKKIKEKSEIIESLSDQLLNFRKQLDDNFKFTEEMKNSNTVLASENDKLVDEKSGFTSELLEAKTCITKLSSDLDKANKEKDETHQKLLDQESRAEALLKDYENLLSNTQDTTVQNQRSLELEFQEKIRLMNEEHDLKCLEMSKLNTEMEEKLREQSEALEKLKGQLQNETTQQSSKIEEILREKNEIIENLRAQHSHFLQNEDSNKEFQEKLDSIHAELDMKGQELASKTTELKNKLMEKENVIVTLQSQLQVSSEKLEERVKLTENITNNNRVLASEKEVIGNEKSALAAELLEAQARISRLTSDLEIANVEKEETYQKLLAQDANAEKLLKDYTSLVMDTRDYSQKIEDLNKECDKLRDFEDKYQEACDALELLKETIVSQSRHKEESEDDASERKLLDLLKEEIHALASENETLKKSLEEKEEELDELESVYKDKEAEEQLSEERILNFQKKVQELIKEKDALVLDKEALQKILDKKEQELKSTKSNSGGVDSQQQLTIAETELKKMTQKLNQTYDQVERLRENCASLQAEKEKLQKNMLSVQDALNEKSVELETYFEVFDEMKKDKEDLEQRCDTLTKQMSERSQQVPASADGSQTELKALLEKHHKTLVELAAIKVEVQREEGEFKKKCKTLANDLQFEKDAVRNLKDKMRRIQSERFDSTIMPPLSKPNSFQVGSFKCPFLFSSNF